MEEDILIHQLQQGQHSALEKIIEVYAAYVSTIVRNVIGNYMKAEDIEEVVADAFVLLWKNAANLRQNGTLKSYLAAIARNQALKKLRNYNPRISLLDDDLLVLNPAGDFVTDTELRVALESALSSLNDVDRDLFLRYYFFMEKTSAIAARHGMKESTVRSRLSRGREFLKRRLTEGGHWHENQSLRPI